MRHEVFHSSQAQLLTRLEPGESTHGCWVYATKDHALAATLLGTLGGDFTCAVGRDCETGLPYICERFEGAFDLRYGGVAGSIYVLPGDTFLEGQTPWDEEVVSPEAVTPIREIQVPDAKEYLLQLVDEGRLILKCHPDRIDGVPDDDEDLVQRAAHWYQQTGQEILERVERYHPNLLERVKNTISG